MEAAYCCETLISTNLHGYFWHFNNKIQPYRFQMYDIEISDRQGSNFLMTEIIVKFEVTLYIKITVMVPFIFVS
jgi:hypothetical protein